MAFGLATRFLNTRECDFLSFHMALYNTKSILLAMWYSRVRLPAQEHLIHGLLGTRHDNKPCTLRNSGPKPVTRGCVRLIASHPAALRALQGMVFPESAGRYHQPMSDVSGDTLYGVPSYRSTMVHGQNTESGVTSLHARTESFSVSPAIALSIQALPGCWLTPRRF